MNLFRSLVFFLLIAGALGAQNLTGGGEARPDLLTNRQSLDQWRDLRFGMFIHWGPIALRGTEIGWSRGKEVPFEEYDALYEEFNPVLFNADDWVGAAKAAGMKYIILVTKHHDGFTLWDSKFTEYDIMASPFKRDIVAEIAAACKTHGLLFGTYYSILDWYHPDYPLRISGALPKEGAEMTRYIEFMKYQLTELVVRYGSRILWFDGEWEAPWTHDMGMELYAWARRLDNGLLINNRVDKGRQGMEGVSKSAAYAGDYETPEQRVGGFNIETPWETCMTICNQWAWKANDTLKTTPQCIETLLRTVGGDGNLLLNVSPMLDGRLEQRQINRLREIGDWLKVYGETVYGSRGGPVPPAAWGVTTCKGDRIFVHVFDADTMSVSLPPLPAKVKKAWRFRDKALVPFVTTATGTVLELPARDEQEIVRVIELEMKPQRGKKMAR